MKRKAIVSTVASVVLAGAMCVGFAACGGNSAKDLKGEEVDKATWDAAFESVLETKNFKLEITREMNMEIKFGDKTAKVSGNASVTYTYADAKTYAKGSQKTSVSGDLPDEIKDYYKNETKDIEYYAEESANDTKYIAKVDGKWAYVENTKNEYSTAAMALEGISYVINSTNFEDYEYSAEHKGYVEKDAEEGELLVIKFQGGKLKAIYAEATEDGVEGKGSESYSYMITYDGQSVTLPTVG